MLVLAVFIYLFFLQPNDHVVLIEPSSLKANPFIFYFLKRQCDRFSQAPGSRGPHRETDVHANATRQTLMYTHVKPEQATVT